MLSMGAGFWTASISLINYSMAKMRLIDIFENPCASSAVPQTVI